MSGILEIKHMDDQEKQRRKYKLLAVVFGIAGAVFIVNGFFTTRYILYPLIGLVLLAIAYFCKQSSV
jgi:hypothetical protein